MAKYLKSGGHVHILRKRRTGDFILSAMMKQLWSPKTKRRSIEDDIEGS